MIALSRRAEGVVLPVRAQPGARKAGILGEYNGALKVAVTAPPEDGRANAAIVALICEALGVRRSQMEWLAGTTAREKKLLIRGMELADLEAIIGRLTSPPG